MTSCFIYMVRKELSALWLCEDNSLYMKLMIVYQQLVQKQFAHVYHIKLMLFVAGQLETTLCSCHGKLLTNFFLQCKLTSDPVPHDTLIQWISGQRNWMKAIPKLIVSLIHSNDGNTGQFAHQDTEEHLTNGLLDLTVHTGKYILLYSTSG